MIEFVLSLITSDLGISLGILIVVVVALFKGSHGACSLTNTKGYWK